MTAAEQTLRQATHSAYRGDIDGLRTIAVLPVVFFHVGIRGFSGGFVGVDIFFVISGYLITGILVRDLALQRHSIAEFYRRRILRIFPALTAMMLATTAGAIAWLMPTEWPLFAKSLGAAALFGSNIGFYLSTDYFNAGALAQPLLHTWSLAVEEQWYLLWPVILALIGPNRPGLMRAVIIAITLLSLGYAIWILPQDQAAAFYLLPARAWELGLGAGLAIMEGRPLSRRVAEVLSIIGLALIGFAIKFYTDDTAFPGLAAVPPCLGAALLIMAGRSGTRVGQLLSLPPMRFIGLISYSLYLWHWPVIIFAENGLFLGDSIPVKVTILTVIFALATASWWFVERPFRTRASGWPTRRVLTGGGLAIAATVAVAVATPGLADALRRFAPEDRRIASYLAYDGDGAYRRNSCFKVGWRSGYDADQCLHGTGKRAILFVGDSHAAQLWPGLSRYRDRFDILQATATGCLAKIAPEVLAVPGSCEAVVNGALTGWLRDRRPAALILASRWRFRFLDGLEETLRNPLVRRSNPVLIGPVPQYSTSLPRLIVAAQERNDPRLPVRAQIDEPFAIDATLKAMAARTGTRYISLVDLLCDKARHCRTLASDGVPLQFDFGHLTAEGSAVVVDAILPQIVDLPIQAAPAPPPPRPVSIPR